MNSNVTRGGDDVEFHYLVRVPGPAGEMTLLLESELYVGFRPDADPDAATVGVTGFGRRASVYPVTIVQARYNGTYEGAPWLAFPVSPHELAERGWVGWAATDLVCAAWFRAAAEAGWLIGRGPCADGAYDNLLDRLCSAAGVDRAELEAEPAWPRQAMEGDDGNENGESSQGSLF